MTDAQKVAQVSLGMTLVVLSFPLVAASAAAGVVCLLTGLALLSLAFAGGPNPRV
jgi:hypothetical protein